MALRFPRGGMGLVIGGGLVVFSIYYVGLIAGESLGNRGIVRRPGDVGAEHHPRGPRALRPRTG